MRLGFTLVPFTSPNVLEIRRVASLVETRSPVPVVLQPLLQSSEEAFDVVITQDLAFSRPIGLRKAQIQPHSENTVNRH